MHVYFYPCIQNAVDCICSETVNFTLSITSTSNVFMSHAMVFDTGAFYTLSNQTSPNLVRRGHLPLTSCHLERILLFLIQFCTFPSQRTLSSYLSDFLFYIVFRTSSFRILFHPPCFILPFSHDIQQFTTPRSHARTCDSVELFSTSVGSRHVRAGTAEEQVSTTVHVSSEGMRKEL